MKLIAGLGNPGKEFEKTRHNAGFIFLDEIVARPNVSAEWKEKDNYIYCKVGDVVLCKPQTFMNRSGEAVAKIMNFYKISVEDILVVHDDLDILLGEYKQQYGKGPRIHNGVNSVEQSLNTKSFWRIRLGIENRKGKPVKGHDYVLEKFKPSELKILKEVSNEAISSL